MKRSFLILLILALLTACTPNPDEPISSADLSNNPPSDFLPSAADGKLLRGAVYLDSIELLVMESYPLQFSLALTGNLPTPCNQLRVAVSQPDFENNIMVDVYSLSTPDVMCVEVLKPFAVNIPLGSFPSGHYSVWINGEQTAEFDA